MSEQYGDYLNTIDLKFKLNEELILRINKNI